MNPISEEVAKGSIGELLVQIRLLQYGVQSAPPIKDSGNDLIAVLNDQFRAIQVKTTTRNKYSVPKEGKKFHLLAVVHLVGDQRRIDLDRSKIYLLDKNNIQEYGRELSDIKNFEISEKRVKALFEVCS